MKNFTCALLLLLLSLFSAAGCTKSVRYSQDEIKDFPPQVQEHIRDSRVAVGMTKMQVRYSWGSPHAVTVLSPSSDGKERVEWTYKRMMYFTSHLIFTDDRLTEIISD
jgi:hypothetical protein